MAYKELLPHESNRAAWNCKVDSLIKRYPNLESLRGRVPPPMAPITNMLSLVLGQGRINEAAERIDEAGYGWHYPAHAYTVFSYAIHCLGALGYDFPLIQGSTDEMDSALGTIMWLCDPWKKSNPTYSLDQQPVQEQLITYIGWLYEQGDEKQIWEQLNSDLTRGLLWEHILFLDRNFVKALRYPDDLKDDLLVFKPYTKTTSMAHLFPSPRAIEILTSDSASLDIEFPPGITATDLLLARQNGLNRAPFLKRIPDVPDPIIKESNRLLAWACAEAAEVILKSKLSFPFPFRVEVSPDYFGTSASYTSVWGKLIHGLINYPKDRFKSSYDFFQYVKLNELYKTSEYLYDRVLEVYTLSGLNNIRLPHNIIIRMCARDTTNPKGIVAKIVEEYLHLWIFPQISFFEIPHYADEIFVEEILSRWGLSHSGTKPSQNGGVNNETIKSAVARSLDEGNIYQGLLDLSALFS